MTATTSLRGSANADDLRGGKGDDTLRGNGRRRHPRGETGDDELRGGAGADELNGGTGGDDLSGGAGTDELNGGSGDDELRGDADADELNGGSGADDPRRRRRPRLLQRRARHRPDAALRVASRRWRRLLAWNDHGVRTGGKLYRRRSTMVNPALSTASTTSREVWQPPARGGQTVASRTRWKRTRPENRPLPCSRNLDLTPEFQHPPGLGEGPVDVRDRAQDQAEHRRVSTAASGAGSRPADASPTRPRTGAAQPPPRPRARATGVPAPPPGPGRWSADSGRSSRRHPRRPPGPGRSAWPAGRADARSCRGCRGSGASGATCGRTTSASSIM